MSDQRMSRPNRQDSKNRTTTGIRFPTDVHARLVEESEARDLSINWLVNRAVAEFLEHLIPVNEMVLTRRDRRPEVKL